MITVTNIIIGITVAFSFIGFQNKDVFTRYMFNPFTVSTNREWWRFFTHAFLHADFMHLLMNMYVLYYFGTYIEDVFSLFFAEKAILFYLLLYIGAVFLSSFPSFEKHKNDIHYNSIGASGAVSAVVFSSILIEPLNSLYLMFIPIPIPAAIFGVLYLIYSWYMAKRGTDNIGHDAHFWGAVFGFVFTAILKPTLVLAFIDQIKYLFQ